MPYVLPHPEAKPPKLDPNRVPASVRAFIPLAERYGISDDGYRVDMLEKLDTSDLEELAAFLEATPGELWEWLAGPESEATNPSTEYVTFSCLVMAAEYAKVKLDELHSD